MPVLPVFILLTSLKLHYGVVEGESELIPAQYAAMSARISV